MCNVLAYACAGCAGTLHFQVWVGDPGEYSAGSSEKTALDFFWLLQNVYSILQTSWLTSQFIVGWDCSSSQEETLQALLESVLEQHPSD